MKYVDKVISRGIVCEVYFNDDGKNSSSDGEVNNTPGFISESLFRSPDKWFNIPSGEVYREEIKNLSDLSNFDYEEEPVNTWGKEMFSWIFFLVIMVVVWMFIMRRMSGGAPGGNQIFNIGKSRAKVMEKGESTNVTFEDVAHVDEAKEELEEIVDFLMNPGKYTKLGLKSQLELYRWPSRTGKTFLQKRLLARQMFHSSA